jgi:hypothetical protein
MQLPVAPQAPLPLLVLFDAARDGRDQRLSGGRAAGQRTTGTARGHSACHTLSYVFFAPLMGSLVVIILGVEQDFFGISFTASSLLP